MSAPTPGVSGDAPASRPLIAEDYERLLAFRTELRSFLRWSEQAAQRAGLTASIHQLLLVVRGHGTSEWPTVGEVAEELAIRHHSAVELATRAEAMGLLTRERDRDDHRCIRLRLTEDGQTRLETLTRAHLPRIAGLASALDGVLEKPVAGSSASDFEHDGPTP